MGPNTKTGVLIRKRKEKFETLRHKEKGYANMEAETGGMLPQTKKH